MVADEEILFAIATARLRMIGELQAEIRELKARLLAAQAANRSLMAVNVRLGERLKQMRYNLVLGGEPDQHYDP